MLEILAGVLVVGGFAGLIIWKNKKKEEEHYQAEIRREKQYQEGLSQDQV